MANVYKFLRDHETNEIVIVDPNDELIIRSFGGVKEKYYYDNDDLSEIHTTENNMTTVTKFVKNGYYSYIKH